MTNGRTERHGDRILVVDDDPVMLAILTDALRTDGYTPVVTGDPREALALLATDPFDLVIADVVMPHLDGVVLLEKAKERSPATEVLLISGFGSQRIVREARAQGAAGFLHKPFDLGTFRARVREILAPPVGVGGTKPDSVCFACGKPFRRGEGRYRVMDGDAHAECAQSRTACPTCGAPLRPTYSSTGILIAAACRNAECGYTRYFPT